MLEHELFSQDINPMEENFMRALLSALTFGLILNNVALAQPFSADELMDANVYSRSESRKIAEVEDLILDENMQVRGLIIEAESFLGLAEEQRVLRDDQHTFEIDATDDQEYRVIFDLTEEQLQELPIYDTTWWGRAKEGTSNVWQSTKERAGSLWERTKEATSDLLEGDSGSSGN